MFSSCILPTVQDCIFLVSQSLVYRSVLSSTRLFWELCSADGFPWPVILAKSVISGKRQWSSRHLAWKVIVGQWQQRQMQRCWPVLACAFSSPSDAWVSFPTTNPASQQNPQARHRILVCALTDTERHRPSIDFCISPFTALFSQPDMHSFPVSCTLQLLHPRHSFTLSPTAVWALLPTICSLFHSTRGRSASPSKPSLTNALIWNLWHRYCRNLPLVFSFPHSAELVRALWLQLTKTNIL